MSSVSGTIGGTWKMSSVNELMYDIFEMLPDVEMQDEDRIIELIIQASSKLYNHKYYERTTCLKFVNENRAEMPRDYISIRSVLGKPFNHECDSSMGELGKFVAQANEVVTLVSGVTSTVDSNLNYDYSAELKDTHLTRLLTNNNAGWRIVHPGSSLMLKLQQEINRLNESGCLTDDNAASMTYCHDCDHMFSVDTQGRLVTTIHTGLVLIEYLRLPKNEAGELLIPYHADMQDAINAYVLYKLNAKSFNQGREGGQQRMQYWQQQWQAYYLNIKNSLLMPSLSEQIAAIKNRNMFSTDPNTIYSDQVTNPTIRF